MFPTCANLEWPNSGKPQFGWRETGDRGSLRITAAPEILRTDPLNPRCRSRRFASAFFTSRTAAEGRLRPFSCEGRGGFVCRGAHSPPACAKPFLHVLRHRRDDPDRIALGIKRHDDLASMEMKSGSARPRR